nr:unnamed protein product [Callosobruchus analis]
MYKQIDILRCNPASEAEVNILGNKHMISHTTSTTTTCSTDEEPCENTCNNTEAQNLHAISEFPSYTSEIRPDVNNEEISEIISEGFLGMWDSNGEPTNSEGVQRRNYIPQVDTTNTESEEEPIDDSDKDSDYSPSCIDEEDYDKENSSVLGNVQADSAENTVRCPLKPRKRIRCEDK